MEHHYLLDWKSQIPSVFYPSYFLLYNLIQYSGACETDVTAHGIWSHDAHVVMQDISHLKLMTMGFLQTCGYISEQMHRCIKIDINKFFGAFSIEPDEGYIHPPSWIPSSSEFVVVMPSMPIVPSSLSNSQAASPEPFNMDDYCKCRQAEALQQINL